jgi:hypothetical protein
MKKNINKVQISVHKVLYQGHEGEKLRPEYTCYSVPVSIYRQD